MNKVALAHKELSFYQYYAVVYLTFFLTNPILMAVTQFAFGEWIDRWYETISYERSTISVELAVDATIVAPFLETLMRFALGRRYFLAASVVLLVRLAQHPVDRGL